MKTVDIDDEKLSEGSGRCPENPQGIIPCLMIRLCPNPSSQEGRKRAQLPLFCRRGSSVSFLSIDFCGISSQPAKPPVPVFNGSIDNRSGAVILFFYIFRMVCWPRKMRSCHLPGMLSAPCSISTSLSTL